MWVEADVMDQAALDAAVAATVERFGGIDVVIANAGIGTSARSEPPTPTTSPARSGINLIGVYRTICAAVPHLVGRAVATHCSSPRSPPSCRLPGAASYAASKAGVDSLAASLRLELAQYGVTVGSIHPSWIDTDLVRKERGGPADVREDAGARCRGRPTPRRRSRSAPRRIADAIATPRAAHLRAETGASCWPPSAR